MQHVVNIGSLTTGSNNEYHVIVVTVDYSRVTMDAETYTKNVRKEVEKAFPQNNVLIIGKDRSSTVQSFV
jgi:hypothetical protein